MNDTFLSKIKRRRLRYRQDATLNVVRNSSDYSEPEVESESGEYDPNILPVWQNSN